MADMGKSSPLDRQKRIVEILTLLHEGGSFEEAKRIFNEEFDGVDVSEITGAEKALIQGGLNPSEIQKLCNIHAAVFKGNIKDIHKSVLEENTPGHPVHTLKLENQVIGSLLNDEIRWVFNKMEKNNDWSVRERLLSALTDLYNIDKHYLRKENLIFSYMEKYGITAPPKVMWGVDDAVREMIKELIAYLNTDKAALNPLREMLDDVISEIEEMIFKEEAIMIPMCLDVFSLDDWEQIESDSAEIGYCFIAEPLKWRASSASREIEKAREPERLAAIEDARKMTDGIAADGAEAVVPKRAKKRYDWEKEVGEGVVVLPTGIMHLNELTALFDVLPFDLSFVDKDDIVRFYSGGERIFPRSKSVIGRRVIDCHPPKSYDAVDKILKDFKSGSRNHADFWIDLHRFNKRVYIRYFAMRDAQTQEYLGCLEVSQEITEIQKLEGEKRLDGHAEQHSSYEDAVADKEKSVRPVKMDSVQSAEMPDFAKKMLAEGAEMPDFVKKMLDKGL